MAGERRPQQLTAHHIPEPNGVVHTGRSEGLAIGAEGHAFHWACMASQRRPQWLAAHHIP
jgi:hypothetical protein